ncbi:MAG: TolC family protein [Candidatus Saelkia tenebricola]|nr:TolC family protein [Candidatus Saelkia tenebricola]
MIEKKNQKLTTVSFVIWFLVTVSFAYSQPYHVNDTVILKDIQKGFLDKKFAITISFNSSPLYHTYWMEDKQTLFVDLIGSNLLCMEKFKLEMNSFGLQYATVKFYPGYEPGDSEAGKVDGIVIKGSKEFKHNIISDDNTIKIIFPEIKEVVFSQNSKEEETELPKSFSFTPEQKIGPQDEEEWQQAILGWQRWIDIGIENYRPLQIATEQYELAQMKAQEARRQFFPTAVVRLVDTVGETTGKVNIISKSAEIEFEQPLSYGGELQYKLEQAKINMELALMERQQLSTDYTLELKRNFYNVVLNRMNWDTFNKLLAEANKLLAMGKLLYQQGLITEVEYKQLSSSYQQIKFLFVSTQKELSLSELAFRQTLNLPGDEEITLVNWLPFGKVNIGLETALRIAKTQRSELKIRQLVTQFNNLNEQIAKSKNRFHLSLTGKVGKIAEDYESEPEEFRDSWYLGLKVSRPIGNSSLDASVVQQNRPVGMFSTEDTTKSFTKSLEWSIVDRLSMASDEKTARVEFLKAVNEEVETEESIISEVERSYANYVSSLFQIETSLQKLEFHSRRLKVTEGRMKVEEANITELLQGYLDYANEEVNYNRALLGYYIALSSISKACGVESYMSLVTEKPVIAAWENFSNHPATSVSYTPFKLPEFKKEITQIIPTGIQGRIIGVNNQYGMAILNIGQGKGLSSNSKVMVYRNGQEYALLVPARIDNNTAACYLEKGIDRDFKGLRIGDNVEILQ